LKELSRIQLNLNHDKGEILISTSHDSLHKHGYRPFVRWGVLNETLAAACILESGILERATRTGKLYLWDPFCGSGSFLIEALMAFLDQPVRNMEHVAFPFEEWPIHKKDEYERFKSELSDFKKVKHDVDVQIIGSDISIRAIDTASKNMQYAKLTEL
jgi:putative N6-adenine-specific DNA methylase